MPLPPAQVKQLCRQSLPKVGTDPAAIQNGVDFYKFFFTNHPNLRSYFKGAEDYDAEAVQKSERFARLGTGMITSNTVMADLYDDPEVFKAYIRELVDRHRERKLAPELWGIFHSVFMSFLESKKPLTADEKAAWTQLGKDFADEANAHLIRSGLPHV
uniref:Globin family profile domain-containing protein n=1 Tax=Panagrolaimus sp. JU765 TaxID=591449 RepID=A0AC34PYA8_9BILA